MTERNTSDQQWANNVSKYPLNIPQLTAEALVTNVLIVQNSANVTNLSCTFPTTGGTPTQLNYYENFSANASWVGPFSTTQNITVSKLGNSIVMNIAGFSAAATATASLTAAGFLPSRFRPALTRFFVIPGIDSNVNGNISVQVNTSGDIIISRINGTSFVNASGTCGPANCSISFYQF